MSAIRRQLTELLSTNSTASTDVPGEGDFDVLRAQGKVAFRMAIGSMAQGRPRLPGFAAIGRRP
jgi:hypothetical protein